MDIVRFCKGHREGHIPNRTLFSLQINLNNCDPIFATIHEIMFRVVYIIFRLFDQQFGETKKKRFLAVPIYNFYR